MRSGVRNYLGHQIDWSISLLPHIQAYRTKSLDKVMRLASLLGSEEFYVATIPLMTWLIAPHNISRVVVMLFGMNMAMGNFLKNTFALPRPPLEHLVTKNKPLPGMLAKKLDDQDGSAAGEAALVDRSLDARDFGWPSVHSINATTLPFFILRCVFGSAFIWTVEAPGAQIAAYVGCLAYTTLICFSRMYLGVHSPADVQGGMLLGALQLRVWLATCDGLEESIMASEQGVLSMIAITAVFLMLHPKVRPGTYTQEESVCLVGFVCGFIAGFYVSESTGIPVLDADIYPQRLWFRALARVLVGFPTMLISKEVVKVLTNGLLSMLGLSASSKKVVLKAGSNSNGDVSAGKKRKNKKGKKGGKKAAGEEGEESSGGDNGEGKSGVRAKLAATADALVSEAVGQSGPGAVEAVGGDAETDDVNLSLSYALARYVVYFFGYGVQVTLVAPLLFRYIGI